MTMPAFPSTLVRRPLRDGYGHGAMPATLRTEMESGQARVRRRFTRTPTGQTVCWNLPAFEWAIMDGWWHDILQDGSAWFTMQLRNGYDDVAVNARSMSPPQATLIAPDTYRVTWELEVEYMPRLSADDYAGLLIEPVASLGPDGALLHTIVHTDYPATTLAHLGP